MCIPINRSGPTLVIAMADPSNIYAIDDLRFMTNYNIEVVVASESSIARALEQYYNISLNQAQSNDSFGGIMMENIEDIYDDFDLDDIDAGWTEAAVEFTLRDHCSAAHGGRIWLIGGMTEQTMWPAIPRVYDPAAGTWSDGPELPLRSPIKGFGCGATAADGRLYVNTAEGILQLSEDESAWETIARPEPGRLFAQLVAHRGRLLLLGGGTGMAVTPDSTVSVVPLGQ